MNLQNLVDYCKLNNDPSPLDGVVTPAPIDAEIVKSYIMLRCGLLTPVYNEPDLFRESCRVWFSARSWEFEHLVNMLKAKYSPIENVDRYDEWKRETTGDYKNTESGKDTTTKEMSNQRSGTDTETTDRETENTISAFNSSSYQPDNKTTNTGDIEMKHGLREDIDDETSTNYGHVLDNDHHDIETYDQHLHGNIGVTSNQKMMNEELDLLERFNVYDWIASQFETDMMVCIY